MPLKPLVVKSFAKLNLYLQVLNKRKDGFHNLSTLFARINLSDTLIFKERKDHLIKVKSNSVLVPRDQSNLCWRAAHLLRQELNLSSGIQIELKKCIPVGAGLGGGSGNAAGVLLGLNEFWNLGLSRSKLVKLGAKLGSDVPFFIYQKKFAEGSRRGDKIKLLASLDKLKLWFVLVYPDFRVSTPLIYRKFDGYTAGSRGFSRLTTSGRNVRILILQLLKKGRGIDPACLVNDLEAVTSSLYPVVNQVKKALLDIGLEKVIMSGSGPAVFAICDSGVQAKKAMAKLQSKHKSWQVFAVSTI